ncbi:MAG: hypothetical protein ABSC49_00095 [Candidatus Microgenomates bacterium]|jgi:hypothetical protein
MVNKGSVRRKSIEIFQKVIELRKSEHSYTEISKETGVAKSTINNWLTLAGLTLTKEHLQIQAKKRVENHVIAIEASKRTRARRKDEDIQNFILKNRQFMRDPLFVAGVMLYEAEGTKVSNNGFSDSDFRLILVYLRFLETYFHLNRNIDLDFRVYIHEVRKDDLNRIINFWAKKLSVDGHIFSISWKHNIVSKKQENLDYVGQINVRVRGVKHFSGKILAISSIMLSVFQR